MKIWLVNPFSDLPNEGASEGRFCCLARLLVAQGHTVTWWTVDFHHRTKSRRDSESVRLSLEQWGTSGNHCEIKLLSVPAYSRNISLARLRSHAAYGRAFAKAAHTKITSDPTALPDVIHLSAPPLDCIDPALEMRKRYGCRVTVDIMDVWPETFYRTLPTCFSHLGKLLFAPLHRRARLAYLNADGISAVSQEYLDLVAKTRSTALNADSIPTPLMNPSASDLHLCYVGGELIEQAPPLSDGTSCIRFIYVGGMSPTYDLWTVLEAVEHLQKVGEEFEVYFAGGGISEPELQAEVARRDLSDKVKFLGFLNQLELQEALLCSDVGLNTIQPGTCITMPHKLSDYLCAGLAVINSTEGEPAVLLEAADAGCTYTAGDANSLMEMMQTYLSDPAHLKKQRMHARQLASARFDRTKTYPLMIEFILGETS